MELLMEKLRSKSSQYKSFGEYAKAIRMSQLEKRFTLDLADRSQLQKCLDTLLQSMSVHSLQGMVERLESISRQLNLKMMGQTGLELFISSDMFYVEIALEPSGQVKDVKVHHEGKPEQQSCETLVRALSKSDFDDFTAQLEGLISIYQLNAEKKVKCKAFSALCALESDLETMYAASTGIKDVHNVLNASPVGVLEKRRGGHTMRLTYFISPYDVLAAKHELTLENISEKNVGNFVTICLEGSAAHKLQSVPIITISKTGGKSVPVAAPLTQNNSSLLPAYFALKLNKPMPICVDLIKQIAAITELDCMDLTAAKPIFSVITRHVSNDKIDSSNNKPLFVNLPDQVHCYFMTENKNLLGVIVHSIPFTHPSHVPQILSLLKQQAVFNCLVASAVRVTEKQDLEKMIMLEVSALSWRQLSITFEHPLEENIATLEMDLIDLVNPSVRLYSTLNTDTKYISKVLQRCLSIPVTMRALIKSLEQQVELAPTPTNGAFSSAPNGGLGGPQEPSHDFNGPIDPSKIKTENGSSNGRSNTFADFTAFSATVLDATPKINEVKKPKQALKEEMEIIVESSSSDSERDDLRKAKKAKVALDPKTLTTPSVTITPITSGSSINSVLSGIGLERRPGIEIIPFTTAPPANLPSSITITPIPSDKDLKRSRPVDDRDKKKKRKREDETKMGPPDKVPAKNDALSKPVSVSIKPSTEVPPSASSPRPTSPSVRKYTSSPTQQFREKSKGSPSPRHSPVYTSPKNSPKHGSPKASSGNSTKPNVTSVKSSSSSATPKNPEMKKTSSSSSSSKEQRDRERKNASSPKIKSSMVKLKPLDFIPADISLTNISPPPADPKCANNPLQRNRKGSLSAVIDKLKSAQEVVDPAVKEKIVAPPSSTTITKVELKPLPPGSKQPEGVKNPAEYMVKTSLDSMKMTINKTRSKEGSKGSSSKTHTGLKPGVVSGPASKKPSVPNKPTGPPKILGSSSSKPGLSKPNPKPLIKSGGVSSPKLPTDLSKKDPTKMKPSKPEKGVFKDGQKRGSPISREEDVLKSMKLDAAGLPSSLVKPFDTKFQIPKLSARNNPAPISDTAIVSDGIESPNNNNILKSDKITEKLDIKVIEVGTIKAGLDLAAGLKYQSKVDSDRMAKTANTSMVNRLSLPLALTNISPKLPMTSPNMPTTSLSSITSKLDKLDDAPTTLPSTDIMEAQVIDVAKLDDPTKTLDNCTASPAPDILLDFSSSQSLQAKLAIVDKSSDKILVGGGTQLPLAADVASPAPAVDDDLMNEAIMMRK